MKMDASYEAVERERERELYFNKISMYGGVKAFVRDG